MGGREGGLGAGRVELTLSSPPLCRVHGVRGAHGASRGSPALRYVPAAVAAALIGSIRVLGALFLRNRTKKDILGGI